MLENDLGIVKAKMSRFERMVALPEDEYNLLRNVQQANNPVQQQFSQLSTEYDRQRAIPDPYTRIHRQGETLDAMIRLKDELRDRLKLVTPKPYQSRAESLYDYLKNKLTFTDKGELMDDGKAIADSNITDLIQHAVRDRRRNITPIGWKSFLSNLQHTNAPKMLLSYDTLEELRSPSAYKRSLSSSPPETIRSPSPKVKQSKRRHVSLYYTRGRSRGRGRGAKSKQTYLRISNRDKKEPDRYLPTDYKKTWN